MLDSVRFELVTVELLRDQG